MSVSGGVSVSVMNEVLTETEETGEDDSYNIIC